MLVRRTEGNSPKSLVSRKTNSLDYNLGEDRKEGNQKSLMNRRPISSSIILVRRTERNSPKSFVSRKADSLDYDLGEKDRMERTHNVGEQEDQFPRL